MNNLQIGLVSSLDPFHFIPCQIKSQIPFFKLYIYAHQLPSRHLGFKIMTIKNIDTSYVFFLKKMKSPS